jgi:hypothetical protein
MRSFAAMLCVVFMIVAIVNTVRAMPAAAQQKVVWDYHCFITFDGAMDFLNNLSNIKAENAKFVAVNSDRAFGQPYCVVYQK